MRTNLSRSQSPLRAAENIYEEVLSLSDEVNEYFEISAPYERKRLAAIDRALFTCESLKISTRLMHVISWCLVRRAVDAGELTPEEGVAEDRRLGDRELCCSVDYKEISNLPPPMLQLIRESVNLYERVMRLEARLIEVVESPAGPANTDSVQGLLGRLESTF
ncbi:MAG: DUF1465 family protein [Pseudomonadota bacterium]